MSHSHATSPLAAPIRALLTQAPASALPMTYQQVANTLGLTPPRTIARVAQALEQLMEEDVAAGRPMIAALVISRRGEDLPASGFFEKAVVKNTQNPAVMITFQLKIFIYKPHLKKYFPQN